MADKAEVERFTHGWSRDLLRIEGRSRIMRATHSLGVALVLLRMWGEDDEALGTDIGHALELLLARIESMDRDQKLKEG